MGKKHGKDKADGLKINVEIAPGNQTKMDLYIKGYNSRPDRKTPKIKYTDLVNDALDRFLSGQAKSPKARSAEGRKSSGGSNGKEKEGKRGQHKGAGAAGDKS